MTRLPGFLVGVLALCLCQIAQASNELADHPSPYLALHANDPVDWKSWRSEVFSEARRDNRLVLVSIGYFSCHWCHVMQRESYQNAEIAKLLNQRFVPVKIDRELEPDLDRRLIDFVEQVRGAAGWPLNVFLTPEGYPLTGFTYLPPDEFLRLLQHLDREWRQNHDALNASARAFFESGLLEVGDQRAQPAPGAGEMLASFVDQALQSADMFQGGFGDTSKFPAVPQLDALLDSLELGTPAEFDVIDFVQQSLESMRTQNLMDHVNGGFFRYTTDPDWQTPHFEKMLYDNAMLATLFLKAQARWPEQDYAASAWQTLDFIETWLRHPEGGYMSSLSAVDERDREGGAYRWDDDQLAALLDAEELAYLGRRWRKHPLDGDFLLRPLTLARDPSGINERIRRKLEAGNGAIMPADDKRLASWNAMMLRALTLASTDQPRFEERARRLYREMRELFFRDGVLLRFRAASQVFEATFEDYAETAYAFMRYAQRFDEDDAMASSRQLVETARRKFLVEGRWQTDSDALIPVAEGKWVVEDLVLFSPMTLWLYSALELDGLDPAIQSEAADMLQRVSPAMIDRPYYYASIILLRARESN